MTENINEKITESPPLSPLIKIRNLSKVYVLGKEKIPALDGVNLDIYENEICCLLGTSGSGKSTLLNMMAGLEKPTRGKIYIDGHQVDKMSERKLALFRQKEMGFVFQSYNLLPNLNAIDNVGLPLAFSGMKKSLRVKKAKNMLKKVGLGKRMKHKPTQMSGGQQQRVGIARAFVAKPKIVFADEPTGNLDSKTTIEVMEMMVDMARKNHQTLIVVTHDEEIAEYADRIFHIKDGKIDNTFKNLAKDKRLAQEAQYGQYTPPDNEKQPDERTDEIIKDKPSFENMPIINKEKLEKVLAGADLNRKDSENKNGLSL